MHLLHHYIVHFRYPDATQVLRYAVMGSTVAQARLAFQQFKLGCLIVKIERRG